MSLVKIEIQKIIDNFDIKIATAKHFTISDTILIAGSPRSGTTWLMELLERIPSYRHIFEPLNPNEFPESLQKGFQSRTYLPPDTYWPEGENYLLRTFTGRTRSLTNKHSSINSPQSFFLSIMTNKLIVKEVRANRLLPWIAKRFPLKAIIFIIRHPCAVIYSQLKTGYTAYHNSNPPYTDITPSLENILAEASTIDGLENNVLNKLKRLETQEELLAATWCLDNYVPLFAPQPHLSTVIYEKIFTKPEKEIPDIFSMLGIKRIPHSVLKQVKKPSKETQRADLNNLRSGQEQLIKWKKYLSEKQITRILKVVSDFGLDFYTKETEPDYDRFCQVILKK